MLQVPSAEVYRPNRQVQHAELWFLIIIIIKTCIWMLA